MPLARGCYAGLQRIGSIAQAYSPWSLLGFCGQKVGAEAQALGRDAVAGPYRCAARCGRRSLARIYDRRATLLGGSTRRQMSGRRCIRPGVSARKGLGEEGLVGRPGAPRRPLRASSGPAQMSLYGLSATSALLLHFDLSRVTKLRQALLDVSMWPSLLVADRPASWASPPLDGGGPNEGCGEDGRRNQASADRSMANQPSMGRWSAR